MNSVEEDMVNNRWLDFLRHLCNGLGVIMLLALAFTTQQTVHYHFKTYSDPIEQQLSAGMVAPYPLWIRVGMVCDGIANAYLAFFIAAVLYMLKAQKPHNVARAERFLKLACAGLVGKALILAVDSFIPIPGRFDLLFSLTHLLGFFADVVPPLLYASLSYVFYIHLKRLITFESETA